MTPQQVISEVLRILERTVNELRDLALKLKTSASSDATRVTISDKARKKNEQGH